MSRRTAFTLIELLVVIAIIALLISILLPSLSRAREMSKRTYCGTNLRGIGQACYIYAHGSNGAFPMVGGVDDTNSGRFEMFNPSSRDNEPSTTGIPSPTVDLWLLVRAGDTTPAQFVCPSTTDSPDPAQDATAHHDFYLPIHLSYAYQFQHDPNRPLVGTTSEPSLPFMADSNPYVKGRITANLASDRASVYRGNSTNHTSREGQNVLFLDGHVTFEKGPDVGPSGNVSSNLPFSRGRDNIYSWHTVNGLVDPGSSKPIAVSSPGICNLGTRSDICLIP